jgi:hypothetical protein
MGSIVTGLAIAAGHFVHLLREVNGVVGLSVAVVVGYVIAARRGAGATLGEGLFTVDFRSVVPRGRRRRLQSGTNHSGDGNAGIVNVQAGTDEDVAPVSPAS